MKIFTENSQKYKDKGYVGKIKLKKLKNKSCTYGIQSDY